MATTLPAFPVLCIGRNGFLTAVANRDLLETCGQSALDSGYFAGMTLVDSTGRSWEVRSAEKIAAGNPLGGWRLLHSRRLRIRLDLVEGHPFDLAALQDRVSNAIDQLPAQWEVVEETTDTKARVRRAKTIREIIGLFVGQS